MESGTGRPVLCSAVPASHVALVAALELEARIPRRTGTVAAPAVYTSGPGRDRAFAAAKNAIAAGAGALVSWGLAGALSPAAATGTVLLPATVVNGSGQWRTDDAWRARLSAQLSPSLPVSEGPLYTADHVITRPDAKAELARHSGAVAVDMESSGLARAAAEAALPFIVVRVVADGAADALPDDIESLVTDDGRTRYRGLAGVFSSPGQIALLLRLARNSGRARAVLRQVIALAADASR